MSDPREEGLLEIKERIKEVRTELDITSFRRTPTNPLTESDLTAVVMLEGTDNIFKHDSRGNLGYPAQRELEVIIELIANKNKVSDLRGMSKSLRTAIFTVRNTDRQVRSSKLVEGAFISEKRTEGPVGYGLPDIKVMRIVFSLIYTDGGL